MNVSINNNNNNNNGTENKYELFERWLNENHSEFSMVSFFSLWYLNNKNKNTYQSIMTILYFISPYIALIIILYRFFIYLFLSLYIL